MTSSLPPSQEPPKQGAQPETAPETTKAAGSHLPSGPFGLRRFFRNLLWLARATEAEVAYQAGRRVEESVKKIDMEKQWKEEFTKKVEEIVDKKRGEVEETGNKAKEDINKSKIQLSARLGAINLLLIFVGSIAGIMTITYALPIIEYFLSINTATTKIESLEADIEELREEVESLRGN